MKPMAHIPLSQMRFHYYFNFVVEETFDLKTAAFLLGRIAHSDSTPKRPALHLALVPVKPILIKNPVWMRPHERYHTLLARNQS
jgi:hypothetical protein